MHLRQACGARSCGIKDMEMPMGLWSSKRFFTSKWPKMGTSGGFPARTGYPTQRLRYFSQRRPEPGRISAGCTRFWLLITPSATYTRFGHTHPTMATAGTPNHGPHTHRGTQRGQRTTAVATLKRGTCRGGAVCRHTAEHSCHGYRQEQVCT